MSDEPQTAEEFWESFYAEGRGRWSGNPNASLVEEIADRAAGSALDLGCGHGADAIWLAQRGWRVTAVDISERALATARREAREAGVADAITFERHNLAISMPDGAYDLVAATFLHSPVELPFSAILRAAADHVAPGGTLLVIGHAPSGAHPHVELPSLEEITDAIAPATAGWTTRTAEHRTRLHAFRGEEPAERVDTIVRVERPAGS